MERAGFRTQIMLRMPSHNGSWGRKATNRYRLEIPIKEYGQVLDLPRVMFWLAHPAALREIIIGYYRQYRDDGIYSDANNQEITEQGAIVSPPFTLDRQLDEWLMTTLKANGLEFEV
jgi:hypothetical protein